jgi:NADH:ubiquinone oxidoreductase subunit 4 (subunit M)
MFGETNATTVHFTDVTPLELTVLSILAGMVILLGFWPNLIFDIGSLSVNSLWFNSVVH